MQLTITLTKAFTLSGLHDNMNEEQIKEYVEQFVYNNDINNRNIIDIDTLEYSYCTADE